MPFLVSKTTLARVEKALAEYIAKEEENRPMSVEDNHYYAPKTPDLERPNAHFMATIRQALYDAKTALELRPMNEPIGLESQSAINSVVKALELTRQSAFMRDDLQDRRNETLEDFLDQLEAHFRMLDRKGIPTPLGFHPLRQRATELRLERGQVK